ncbi:hypothetical protein DSO57_1013131 [Entomophthora muscae]|uniref:Uncharacterized protein n=1 Tax=Entomophthora muscae TaxID=34485 RepID=A0ACC2SUZ1_9FUNG|nr:hypothetical protein DSO57_1013131 [Entomophthora muscae]
MATRKTTTSPSSIGLWRAASAQEAVAFYNKVHMPCVPVPEKDPSSTKPIKAAQKLILNIKRIILLRLMQESCNYKTVASLVGVDPKYISKVFNKYIDTSQVLAVEKSLHVSTISFENQIFIYKLVGGMRDTTGAYPTCMFSPCSPRSTNG